MTSHLIPSPHVAQHLLVADLLHVPHLLHPIGRLHSDEGLGKRDGSETAVEEEEALVEVDPQEPCHVHVVREGCRETNDSDQSLTGLNLGE